MNVKPYVIAIASITMDGKIANPFIRNRFTCRYDLERLFKARDEVDATIVGAQTVMDVDGTYTPKTGKQILRVLIDGAFRVPLESKFLSSPAPALVAVTERAPRAKIELARKAGIEVMEFNKQVDVEVLLSKLADRGIKKVLVEGGGVVFWQFFARNLIDEVRLTIAPFMMGKGTSLIEGDSLKIDQSPKFKPVKWYLCECGREVVVHYTRE
ncbi:dihydrofolate reductase family protein [Caldivirga sp. UBA161]|uniref:dihydrofolate reductase family protein n=1 Tax=Caldivirga sp. UBA161 TaxID=1915569 RepID=UPI0025B90FF6|nr:dihydrofolate reductase family protein [Caldivirga sp. UBA161]